MKPFRKTREKLIIMIAFAVVAIALCACSKTIPSYIATSATVEAGSTFTAEDFVLEGGHTAKFADDFAARFAQDGYAKINQIGTHTIALVVDGESYSVSLTVQDTVAPKASARMVTVCQGDLLQAKDCVTNIEDQTTVSCSFEVEPNLTQLGVVNEIVILTDEAGNCTKIPVAIAVIRADTFLADSYTIEAGDSIPAAESLVAINQTGTYVTDVSVINTSLVGSYTLELEIEGAIHTTNLIIKDTIAPTAVVAPITVYYGAKFPPADSFVTAITDKGPVTVSYDIDPGAIVIDQTVVRIVLTDQSGNRTYYNTQCSIEHDNEAPKFISFPEKIDADVGSTIIWRSLVSAEDNSGIVELSLDTSAVNLEKPGTYTAFLVAEDPAENETKQEVKIVLHDNSVTKEMMDQVCEEIISEIITDDMTTQEKLYEIYKYVVNNIKYTSDSPHDDIRREAYLSLTSRPKGDCFAFCAAAHELIAYLGYETQIVRRDVSLVEEYGNHFWVLVNCGTEEAPLWYHHDASPHSKPYDLETYMMTDAQLKAYTNYRASTSSKKHYYSFDASLHPASATEIVVDLGIDSRYFQ